MPHQLPLQQQVISVPNFLYILVSKVRSSEHGSLKILVNMHDLIMNAKAKIQAKWGKKINRFKREKLTTYSKKKIFCIFGVFQILNSTYISFCRWKYNIQQYTQ